MQDRGKKRRRRVWTWADPSAGQGQEVEGVAEDERHDNLAGDTACSDSVSGQREFIIRSRSKTK